MKLTLIGWLLVATAVAHAKNVVDLSFSDEALTDLEKRDAKNTVSFDFTTDDLDKRDAETAKLVVKTRSLEKRQPKNVAHFNFDVDLDTLEGKKEKRSPRNVASLNLVMDDGELSRRLVKRGAKNVVSFDFNVKDDDFKLRKVKRDDGAEITQLLFDVKSEDAAESEDESEVSSFVLDLPHRIIEELARGAHRVSVSVGLEKPAAKAGSIVIPEIGDLTDDTGSLKYTLMPSVKSGTLALALNSNPATSIFASYVRDLMDIYKMCDSTDDFNINARADAESDKDILLVFAPTNEAIMSLSVKPWQFPKHVDDDDDTAKENVRSFVESHIARVSSRAFGEDKVVNLVSLNGNAIDLKNTEAGFKYRLEGFHGWQKINAIEVLDNGALLSIGTTLSWPERKI